MVTINLQTPHDGYDIQGAVIHCAVIKGKKIGVMALIYIFFRLVYWAVPNWFSKQKHTTSIFYKIGNRKCSLNPQIFFWIQISQVRKYVKYCFLTR